MVEPNTLCSYTISQFPCVPLHNTVTSLSERPRNCILAYLLVALELQPTPFTY